MPSPDTSPLNALVIDDEEVMVEACRRILERMGMSVDVERDPFAGRERVLSGPYALLVVDLRMPELSGLEILAALHERRSDVEVIMITGYTSIETAVQAVKLGAFDYLPKPFTPDELRTRVEAALAHRRERLAVSPPEAGPSLRLIAQSPQMLEVRDLMRRVAPTDATVLINGESGTGKELAAIEIHAQSLRCDRPMVSLDCSALAPGLLESELFGHVKGSFTGALTSKPGLFEIADQGTLFLDELASLSLDTQGKLLRVLETGELKPVGGVAVRRVDIRLIAATNRDLGELVAEHAFREDLYYRINVVPLRLPPLRERTADVAPLLHHFLGRYGGPRALAPRRFSPEAIAALSAYRWPGNVRELKNLVERLVVTTEGEVIRLEHLPEEVVGNAPPATLTVPRTNEELKEMKRAARERSTSSLEKAFVLDALRRNGWNVTQAARDTGLLRPNFHALMRRYGVRAHEE